MLSETDYKLIVYDQESKGYGSVELSKEVFGNVDFIKKPHFLFFICISCKIWSTF